MSPTNYRNRILRFLLVFLLLVFLVPSYAHGHSATGAQLKINGEFVQKYTTEVYAQVGDEIIPEDIAKGKYIIKKPVNFEAGGDGEEISDNTTYSWDFGDGKKANGRKVVHAFSKVGTYVVSLEVKYSDSVTPDLPPAQGMGSQPQPQQQSQKVLIHILPNTNYKVPAAKITIDKKDIKNPLSDRPRFNFYNKFLFFKWPKTFTFDASKSSGSEKITSYEWDFGEDRTLEKAKVRYKFKEKSFFYSVGLKITDKNGFHTYSVVNMADESAFKTTD